MVSPVEMMGGETGRLESVRIERNRLTKTEDGSMRPRGTGEYEEIEAGLVFRSIGYRGIPLPGVPFHERWGIVPNEDGRVVAEDGTRYPREYVSGWCKRGPSGVIGTNKPDGAETADAMVEDAASIADELPEGRPANAVEALLTGRRVDYVTFQDWEALDEFELSRGEAEGRPRVKVCHVDEMLEVIHAARAMRSAAAEAEHSVGVVD